MKRITVLFSKSRSSESAVIKLIGQWLIRRFRRSVTRNSRGVYVCIKCMIDIFLEKGLFHILALWHNLKGQRITSGHCANTSLFFLRQTLKGLVTQITPLPGLAFGTSVTSQESNFQIFRRLNLWRSYLSILTYVQFSQYTNHLLNQLLVQQIRFWLFRFAYSILFLISWGYKMVNVGKPELNEFIKESASIAIGDNDFITLRSNHCTGYITKCIDNERDE